MEEKNCPRIFVECLAARNDGLLHGVWVDADDSDEIERRIVEMLASSPSPGAEEWVISDCDGFGPLRIGEHELLDDVARVGADIAHYGIAFAHYAAWVGIDAAWSADFLDLFAGQWPSFADFAQSLFNEWVSEIRVPAHIEPYVTFDMESYVADLELGMMVCEDGGSVFVFYGQI